MSFHNNSSWKLPITHYPYVNIKLGNGVSLTQDPDDEKPNYFVSLEHKRYTNQANTLSLNITFVPTGDQDPNMIENALTSADQTIIFRYGSTKDQNLSNEYIGLIYDYSVSISESGLSYQISAVSQSVLSNYETILNDGNAIKTSDDADKVLDKLSKVISESDGLKDRCTFDKENSSKEFEVTKDVTAVNKSPMQYLLEVAGTLRDTEDPDSHFYKIQTSDINTDSKCTIKLIRTAGDSTSARYTFNWGGKDTDVLSWSIDYKGAMTLFAKDSTEYATYSKTLDVDASGNATAANTMTFNSRQMINDGALNGSLTETVNTFLSSGASATVSDIADFKEKANYSYKATLTVLGIGSGNSGSGGDDIAIGQSLIQVTPILNGKPHHSAGKYVVTSITDKVDGRSGFTTTYDLYRYVEIVPEEEDKGTVSSGYKVTNVGPDGSITYSNGTDTYTSEAGAAVPHYDDWDKNHEHPWYTKDGT